MSWRTDRLPEIVRAMAGRPRHEALRGHVIEILRSGFGASYEEIAHEVYLLDNSGRIDALWGGTVIELKTNLRGEIGDVLARMPAYLADAAARSRSTRPVTGLATDAVNSTRMKTRPSRLLVHRTRFRSTVIDGPLSRATLIGVDIGFDSSKREPTLRKRGPDFAGAGEVFAGCTATQADSRRGDGEPRFITAGVLDARFVVAVWTQRGESRRIISMRHGHAGEQERWADRMG